MKYVITPGRVAEDGESLELPTPELPDNVHAVTWDEARGRGVVQYKEGVTRSVVVRDFAKEEEEYKFALKNNKRLEDLRPHYKTQEIQREPEEITDISRFRPAIDRFRGHFRKS